MKRLLATGLCLMALAARAATGLDAAPAPGPALPIAVPAFESFTLPNGLRVVLAPRRGVPLVTGQLLVLAGREAEPADRAGLAGMVVALLSKGARRGGTDVDAATLARQAEALGGTLDGAAGWRSSSTGMTVTTPRLGAMLALLADVNRAPLLAADELDRARAQSLDGLRVAMDAPGSVAELVARRAWWGSSAYGRSATPASLQRLVIADVKAFHATHWRPDRAVLVLAGDVDTASARPLAEAAFGGWARPAADAATDAPPSRGSPAAPQLPPVVWLDMPGSGQSAVIVSAPALPQGDPQARVAEVAHTLLGGGYSARLNQVIRIERGLSYGAFGGAEGHPAGGVWSGQAQTKHPSAAEVAGLMREAALRIAREPAPAAELEARKAALIGGFANRLQTTGGLASLVASQIAQGRDPAELAQRVDQIRAVTPEQVRDHAARWWKPENLRVTVAGDWAAAGDAVKALGDAVLRLPKVQLDLDQVGLQRR
ncbi:MAG: insulinase family protein [Rubrivivax sp.]|nr:insulinase family protein [Rubrivivax sp.]